MNVFITAIVGARPQFVKAAVVSRALRAAGLKERLVHTGQHFDDNMSKVFFNELEIAEPDVNLGIGGGSHGENTGRMLEAIEAELESHRPDWVLVFGDTDSTLAAALAAVKLNVRVAHVEAGLRSFNRRMPEEINRVLTDHMATTLLAPTDTAVTNLANEGIRGDAVRLVGDVMFDAVRVFGERAEQCSGILGRHDLARRGYVLATLHRPSNTDDPNALCGIVGALGRSKLPVVWPMHPRTARRIAEFGLSLPACVHVTAPLGYLDMVMLERHAALIVTDSGGVQKEAFFHAVPCVTVRTETEWVELLDLGVNQLIGTDWARLAEVLACDAPAFAPRDARQPYGTGDAADRVAAALQE